MRYTRIKAQHSGLVLLQEPQYAISQDQERRDYD
jgi:hypothetical protein